METLTLGRLVSTAAAIGATGVVVRLARAFGGSRRAALVAGGLFISSYVMQPWAYTARPDLLALAFSLGGLWLGLRPGRSSAVGAGFLLAAAFLTKQTHVAALGALVFTALIARHWSRAAMLAATWGTVVLGAASCLQLATAGQFLASIVSPHSQPVHLELIARNLAWFGVFSMPLCSLAALGRRGAGTPATSRVLQCYVLFSTIYALSVLGKTGSIYNHFLQLISGLAVLAAPGFDRLVALAEAAGHPGRCWRERGAPRAAIAWLVIGTGCMLCGSLLQQLTVLIYGFSGSASPALVRVIGESPGSVLTQMDSLVVVLAGKTPVAPDPLELALLAERGAWDSAPLVRAIRSREFSLIVLRGPISAAPRFEQSAWWPPDVQAAIRGSYQPIGQVDGRYLYAPRPTMKRLDQRNL